MCHRQTENGQRTFVFGFEAEEESARRPVASPLLSPPLRSPRHVLLTPLLLQSGVAAAITFALTRRHSRHAPDRRGAIEQKSTTCVRNSLPVAILPRGDAPFGGFRYITAPAEDNPEGELNTTT